MKPKQNYVASFGKYKNVYSDHTFAWFILLTQQNYISASLTVLLSVTF